IYGILQKRNTFEPVNTPTGTAFYNYRFISSDFKFDFKPNILKTYSVGLGLLEENYTLAEGKEDSQIPNTFATQKFLFKLNFDFNRLEQFYYLFSGFRNLIQLNNVWGANFGGENYFYAFENETTFFKRIKTKGNWANRMKIGISRNFETPFPAFVIDNNLNTRGAGNKVRRGSQIAVINTEYRHTLLERKWLAIQGNGFIDSSWILPAGGFINDFFSTKNHNLYSGIGIRIIHKFIHTAILRLDYGFSLNNGRSKGLVFGIGQYF
ncbi:MAG: outer membrane protein assembly factor, partial [Flavobacteriaceae bacterium]